MNEARQSEQNSAGVGRIVGVVIVIASMAVAGYSLWCCLRAHPTEPAVAPKMPSGLTWSWDPSRGGDCHEVDDAPDGEMNALISGGMSVNGFTLDCLSIAGTTWSEKWRNLANGPLADWAAADLDSLPPVCDDPGAAYLLGYLVKCALNYEQMVVVSCSEEPTITQTFRGDLGIATEWRSQALGDDDRQRVSACLMAHTNALGHSVPLRLMGPGMFANGSHIPGVSKPTSNQQVASPQDYALVEGGFFGNLFPNGVVPAGFYALTAPGYAQPPPGSEGRTCTLGTNECGFGVTGTACTGDPASGYTDCTDDTGRAWAHPVTTALRGPSGP
ncbi:hypothetical protein [Haliangium sp.]|uniref:hypothetical protein n=1 Tax=Haliangium sp. TaxID=2663208 RepID=UPI003D0AF860